MLLDQDLKRAFSDLVKIKIFIGLHLNMTERVQGALMRFVSAIGKIGKGIGKRVLKGISTNLGIGVSMMSVCFPGDDFYILAIFEK
ncbi:MAG: hypothetical protein PHG00_04920 [Methylococcales bacterium]|nr:hypothetical protein [Methylococcales bacterium]